MIHIQFSNENSDEALRKLLSQAALETLRQQDIDENSEMSIVLGDDALLKQLNQQHLQEAHATDVLSFPGDAINPESGMTYLGDIAISLERAAAQAEAGGHRAEEELQLLVVHGVLHLLGHDHAEPEEKKQMWTAQDDVLNRLQVSVNLSQLESQ
jgi:probable rRNA maturation factor